MPAFAAAGVIAALVSALAAPPALAETTAQRVVLASSGRAVAHWRPGHAVVSVAHGAARVTRVGRGGRYWISRAPRPVRSTNAGGAYRATARVRASGSVTVCLSLREVSHGRAVGAARSCVRVGRAWRSLPAVSYGARRQGSQLGIAFFAHARGAARSFDVASVKITARKGQPGSGTQPALGVQFHCTWSFYSDAYRAAVLDKLAAAGVRWVRIDIGWMSLQEQARGVLSPWYVNLSDRCVDMARARGMNVLATLHGTPAWANGGASWTTAPSDPADFAWIARWAADHFRGRVAAWEIWNEPNPAQTYWLGTSDQYVRLLAAAYPAIKAADPKALVVLGGASGNDDVWFQRLYALGAKPYFDVLATHPYQGAADAPPEQADDGNRWWLTHVAAVRQVMVANGDAAKPIWFTEFGWSAHDNWAGVQPWERGVTPQVQADYLRRAVQLTASRYPYVGAMFWYKERANPTGTNVHLEGYALLNADLSERPVYAALKSLLKP